MAQVQINLAMEEYYDNKKKSEKKLELKSA